MMIIILRDKIAANLRKNLKKSLSKYFDIFVIGFSLPLAMMDHLVLLLDLLLL